LSGRYAGLGEQMTALEVRTSAFAVRTTYADALRLFPAAAENYSSSSANDAALGNAALNATLMEGKTVMGEGNDLLNGLAAVLLEQGLACPLRA